jgi:hypothetical protein
LVPVIAICAVIALAVAGIATKGFGLFVKSKNPVATTYDALKSPLEIALISPSPKKLG